MEVNKIYQGDCLNVLKTFPSESIDCVITSPPYWALRDYGVDGQLGLEPTFQEYIDKLCDIFNEVKRVLKKEGTCWVNIGDTYASGGGAGRHKGYFDPKYPNGRNGNFDEPNTNSQIGAIEKSLCQIPSRFAIEMTNRGWILRNEIIWHKPNCMPSSVKDRFTVDFEKIFFFVKNKKYWFKTQYEPYKLPMNRWGGIYTDGGYENSKYNRKSKNGANIGENNKPPYKNNNPHLMRLCYPSRGRSLRPNENGKNKRTVWSINTCSFKEAHFATYPEKLIEPMIKAGCPNDGIILDPFFGAGTTGVVARKQNKNYIGIELNPEYIKIAENRIQKEIGLFN